MSVRLKIDMRIMIYLQKKVQAKPLFYHIKKFKVCNLKVLKRTKSGQSTVNETFKPGTEFTKILNLDFGLSFVLPVSEQSEQ